MPASAKRYFDPLVLAKIASLSLRARHVVEGLLSGLHKSPYRGYSVEFAEHREYVPGDEIRRIDWKAYGKFDRYFVKEYEEETNLRAYLFLDASASMGYGSTGLSKFEYGCYLTASLAYLMLRQGDYVGLVTFGEHILRYIPPRASLHHLQALTAHLEAVTPQGPTRLAAALQEMASKITRRGMIVVISDLFDNPDEVLRALKLFRHRRNEVLVFHLLDHNELDFPFQRLTVFEDIEDARVRVLSDPRAVREAYLRQLQAFLAAYQQGCRRERIDYSLFATTTPLDVALTRYLARRQ
ncbi:MAG: hypothetical protein KatS3mg131_2569 [Candidatus Tectimicrobiota bacterium]|nr:MAG: hypothetical protein KatS3mg131_2569 [Candidatus Tectomicrobia bacterium]